MSETFLISRADLAPIFGQNPRVLQQFEEMQRAVSDHGDAIGANVAATGSLADATFVTLSPNAELGNEYVLSVSEGLELLTGTGGVTLQLNAPVLVGGFKAYLTAQGDTNLVLPLTGVLATQQWVTAQGFSSGGAATWGSITGTLASQTDLAGALGGKEPSIAAGTTAQYWRGDKSWQTLDKTAVGLVNVDNTADASKAVLSATKLATARSLSMTGDVTWTVSFDGSGNVTAAGTLANSGVTAATYGDSTHVAQVTVDAKGRVTGASSVAIPGVSFRGCLVYLSADQTNANYTAGPAIAFTTEDYDTDSIHDNTTNNTRLTVPSGVTKVRLKAGVAISATTSNTYSELFITKNALSVAYPGVADARSQASSTDMLLNVGTAVLSVSAGDYFEACVRSQSDTSINLLANRTWFSMEIIE